MILGSETHGQLSCICTLPSSPPLHLLSSPLKSKDLTKVCVYVCEHVHTYAHPHTHLDTLGDGELV